MQRTALVGCAHIHTPGFVRRLNSRADIEVRSVWDHDRARAEKCAAELNATQVADVNAIWSDPDVDAVVICAETNLHEALVLAAAAAGKHLFVEKPLGMGRSDAERMARAIEDAGVHFQTGYFMRGMPAHQFLRDQVRAGSFGSITRLRHSNFHAGALRDIFTPNYLWMTRLDESGIGGFGDLGTHSLDIMLWLLGDVEAVAATFASHTGHYNGLDETGEALLRFSSGVIGSLGAGWLDIEHPVSVLLSGTEGHALVRNGELYFNSAHVEGADGKTPWTALPEAWPHAFDLFFNRLAGDESASLVSPNEAALRSTVMEALYQAADAQAWVAIDK